MRLADEIAAAVGGSGDRMSLGAVGTFAHDLARAECFELSADVARAVSSVQRLRPSSVAAALPFSRPPYPSTWVEWSCAELALLLESRDEPTAERPMPRRMGALIKQIGEDSLAGISWAWSHPEHGINICPFSVIHTWVNGGLEPWKNALASASAAELSQKWFGVSITPSQIQERLRPVTNAEAKFLAEHKVRLWHEHRNNPAEIAAIVELSKWSHVTVNPYCLRMVAMLKQRLSETEFKRISEGWLADLEGEASFIEAFLILLNTKNGAVSEREDLSRLNRARQKSGKSKLREFQITRLALSKHAIRASATGRATRDEARQHYVRGHFKVRKTGVFWWSPFVRGDTVAVVPRERYAVT